MKDGTESYLSRRTDAYLTTFISEMRTLFIEGHGYEPPMVKVFTGWERFSVDFRHRVLPLRNTMILDSLGILREVAQKVEKDTGEPLPYDLLLDVQRARDAAGDTSAMDTSVATLCRAVRVVRESDALNHSRAYTPFTLREVFYANMVLKEGTDRSRNASEAVWDVTHSTPNFQRSTAVQLLRKNFEHAIDMLPRELHIALSAARDELIPEVVPYEPSLVELFGQRWYEFSEQTREFLEKIRVAVVEEGLRLSPERVEHLQSLSDREFPVEVILDVKRVHGTVYENPSVFDENLDVLRAKVKELHKSDAQHYHRDPPDYSDNDIHYAHILLRSADDMRYALTELHSLKRAARKSGIRNASGDNVFHNINEAVSKHRETPESESIVTPSSSFIDTLPELDADDDLRLAIARVRVESRDYVKKVRGKSSGYFVSPLPPELRDKHYARCQELPEAWVPDGVLQPHMDAHGLLDRAAPTYIYKPMTVFPLLVTMIPLMLVITFVSPYAIVVMPPWVWYLIVVALGGALHVTVRATQRAVSRRSPLALTAAEADTLKTTLREIPSTHLEIVSLSLAASSVASNIDASPAWQSRYCDLDRIRLNLVEETQQIADTVARLAELRDLIDSVSLDGDTEISDAIRRDAETRNATFLRAYLAVERRVGALYAYRDGLRSIETLLSDMARVEKLMHTDEKMNAILTDMAMSELASAHTQEMTRDLNALRENLETQLELVRGVVNNPSLESPLRLAQAAS